MKHRIMLATTALLAACGEAPAPTRPNAVALVQGFSASALTTGSYTTVGASTFTVPAGVTSINIIAVGGGGGGSSLYTSGVGGSGAKVTSTVSVTPGQVLDLFVGATSGPGSNQNVGGGGSTTISSGGAPLVIAGGGGGAGQTGAGGPAGAPDGRHNSIDRLFPTRRA